MDLISFIPEEARQVGSRFRVFIRHSGLTLKPFTFPLPPTIWNHITSKVELEKLPKLITCEPHHIQISGLINSYDETQPTGPFGLKLFSPNRVLKKTINHDDSIHAKISYDVDLSTLNITPEFSGKTGLNDDRTQLGTGKRHYFVLRNQPATSGWLPHIEMVLPRLGEDYGEKVDLVLEVVR